MILLSKTACEIGQIIESDLKRHLGDGQLFLFEKLYRSFEANAPNEFVNSLIRQSAQLAVQLHAAHANLLAQHHRVEIAVGDMLFYDLDHLTQKLRIDVFDVHILRFKVNFAAELDSQLSSGFQQIRDLRFQDIDAERFGLWSVLLFCIHCQNMQ